MRKCPWIMSICNKREAVEVFIRTGMNCQEAPVVVVWLTQTHTMRHAESWLRAHSENKNNNMFVGRIRSSKWIPNVPLWHELCRMRSLFFSLFVSQLPNAATCIASPKRLGMWSSCSEWSWMARAALTRTLTVCACVGSARWVVLCACVCACKREWDGCRSFQIHMC